MARPSAWGQPTRSQKRQPTRPPQIHSEQTYPKSTPYRHSPNSPERTGPAVGAWGHLLNSTADHDRAQSLRCSHILQNLPAVYEPNQYGFDMREPTWSSEKRPPRADGLQRTTKRASRARRARGIRLSARDSSSRLSDRRLVRYRSQKITPAAAQKLGPYPSQLGASASAAGATKWKGRRSLKKLLVVLQPLASECALLLVVAAVVSFLRRPHLSVLVPCADHHSSSLATGVALELSPLSSLFYLHTASPAGPFSRRVPLSLVLSSPRSPSGHSSPFVS